ncbi:MAG: double-strand break repair protein AddB [Micavibrio sp.]|nr:double-strand break repair protein AddB [Micavibrio sp.]
MTQKIEKGLYSIAPGKPFLDVLAKSLLDGAIVPLDQLAGVEIYLPTRRACRMLQTALLEQAEDKALIMPRLSPLGDVEEEELSILSGMTDMEFSLAPEMSPLKRQLYLAKAIRAKGDDLSYDQMLESAAALGRLMDHIYTQNLDIKDLATLVPDLYSEHWQVTLEFLKIISENWPTILQAEGRLDRADRRNILMLAQAEYWRKNPPSDPVIIAGTTGSIPATAELMRSVVDLPQGYIILPGLDHLIDEESWISLGETHPQYGFSHLLNQLGQDRDSVCEWPQNMPDYEAYPHDKRLLLARELMRPEATSMNWASLGAQKEVVEKISSTLKGIHVQQCDTERDEAQQIALIMRRALEDETQTACLITPDRALAKRVKAACARWDIVIDDSAASHVLASDIGLYMREIIRCVNEGVAPSSLLSLVRHPLFGRALDTHILSERLSALDIALRGSRPQSGFQGLRRHIRAHERLAQGHREKALHFLDEIEVRLKNLCALSSGKHSFHAFVNAHLLASENLLLSESEGKEHTRILWSGAAGQSASDLFSRLLENAAHADNLSLEEYGRVIEIFMKNAQVRISAGTHPRLQILGQLEARMLQTDIVIMGGLNEGIWPAEAEVDPWMSRPMRSQFGLPGVERSIGLAAHDFVQAFCAKKIYITRSLKNANAPSVPSRWLQRFEAVLLACDLGKLSDLEDTEISYLAKYMDHTKEYKPVEQPKPAPPVHARPRRISVTEVETWLKDPYSIYAKKILGLKKLDDLEKDADAALRGKILHAVLERFVERHRTNLPYDSQDILMQITYEILEEEGEDISAWALHIPRLERIFSWFFEKEKSWRDDGYANNIREGAGQISLQTELGEFILHGRVDRIDKSAIGQAAIMDYKSSAGNLNKKKFKSGDLPQLPIEAWMLEEGGFTMPAVPTERLVYWAMSGGKDAGSEITIEGDDVRGAIDIVRDGLLSLIRDFEREDMPYYSLPRADKVPRFNDYLHLSRHAEWIALDEAQEDYE